MENKTLKDKCHINTNREDDTFVGIRQIKGDLNICFPLGYRLGQDEKSIRKDILNLIRVLEVFTDKKDRLLPNNIMDEIKVVEFPITAYMKIIINYLNNGFYYENEMRYRVAKRGKINWGRTIKTQKSYIQENELFYLDYVVKDNTINQDEMISLIHQYCVYESFRNIGWLYTTFIPQKPRIKFNKNFFLSVIYKKLGQTFNDKSKELFNSMIEVINSMSSENIVQNIYYGTYRFEYVWEKLIDHVFGVDDKERYFPRTSWSLNSQNTRNNSALEPDTIMVYGEKVYVIDAKYYKYGSTAIPTHLPESTSINKQITYGEYIATNIKFREEYGENLKVFNAFLMPFSKEFKYFETNDNLKHIGEATGDWKVSGLEYERVQGVLLDVKHIMYNHRKNDKVQIEELSQLIENNISKMQYIIHQSKIEENYKQETLGEKSINEAASSLNS